MKPALHFIKDLQRIYQYCDEPQFYQFFTKLEITEEETDGNIRDNWTAGGSSLVSEEEAITKTIAEACERYACTTYKRNRFMVGTYKEIPNALDPKIFTSYSKEQKKDDDFALFRFDDSTKFLWTQAQSLTKKEKVMIPANLVFHNYKVAPGENLIILPISNGAAAGEDYASAITRGLLELVERDAFVISWLNQLPLPKVDLNSIQNDQIDLIKEIAKRYRLELHVMDMTNDLGIPAFVTITINRTGVGPAVLSGLKCHPDPIEAIVGSFTEALHLRGKIRMAFEDKGGKIPKMKPEEINTSEKRGLWWYKKSKIKLLDFWIKQKPKPLRHALSEKGYEKAFDNIQKLSESTYYVNLTLPAFSKTGMRVVKVFVPHLQPHYLDEKYRVLGGKRLQQYKRGKLNPYPHPFL
jgi:ribosomal protein S12 methylthiotransferase accessory factor